MSSNRPGAGRVAGARRAGFVWIDGSQIAGFTGNERCGFSIG